MLHAALHASIVAPSKTTARAATTARTAQQTTSTRAACRATPWSLQGGALKEGQGGWGPPVMPSMPACDATGWMPPEAESPARAAHAAKLTSPGGTCALCTLLEVHPTVAGEDGLGVDLDQAGSTPHLHPVSSAGQPMLWLQYSPAPQLAASPTQGCTLTTSSLGTLPYEMAKPPAADAAKSWLGVG